MDAVGHKTWEVGGFFLFRNNKIKLTRLNLEEIIRSYKLQAQKLLEIAFQKKL
jgi:hypothetical protein